MIKLNSSYFDWLAWRNGSIWNIFKVPHRTACLLESNDLIRKYAIGYCDASRIPCKPKKNHIAVMFNTGEENWWTHLRKIEFNLIFPEIKY